MKTILGLLALLAALTPSAHADPFADFQTRVRTEYVKPFALDLGGVLGGASAHTGPARGLPGFWVGAGAVWGGARWAPGSWGRTATTASCATRA